MPTLDSQLLTGRTDTHLCDAVDAQRLGARIHREVTAPFLALRDAAAEDGFDLRIDSGFRDFDRQRSIWNRKVDGALPVLASDATPLDITTLSEEQLVFAILRWSALPGASRHHWGTDVDVFDEAARPEGYEVQLVPSEVDPGGMFGPLHAWLDERIEAGAAFGFFRPYDCDRSGVAPERWHLSHAPVAGVLARALTREVLATTIRGAGLRLEACVLDHLDTIWERFVVNTGAPPT
jgi:LAS superfamily LD-carboxypeptidase LdcB